MLTDEAHHRIYVTLTGDRIAALDAKTGAEVWRTKVADHARPLSVDSKGLLYVGIERYGKKGVSGHALRTIGPEGRGRWQFDTATWVRGARRLPGGSVAISTNATPDAFYDASGLLWRLDPRETARRVRSARLLLRSRAFWARCRSLTCEYSPDYGAVVRIEVPRRTTLQVRLLRRNEPATGRPTYSILAPAGVSYVRLFGGYAVRGPWTLDIRGALNGRPLARFSVVIR